MKNSHLKIKVQRKAALYKGKESKKKKFPKKSKKRSKVNWTTMKSIEKSTKELTAQFILQ